MIFGYARVSTEKEEQLNSYNSQLKYYEKKIKSINATCNMFKDSILEKENNLPYWAKLSPNEIKYLLQKKELFNE